MFLTSCTTGKPVFHGTSVPTPTASSAQPSSKPAAPIPSAAGNHAAAQMKAAELLALANVPESSVPLASAPEHLTGPVLGEPVVDSKVVRSRLWSVPWPFDQTLQWIRTHPPSGNAAPGSTTGSGPGYRLAGYGYSFAVASKDGLASADLQVGVLSDGAHSSVLRVDAVVVWLDPIPPRDPGGRGRIRVPQSACPASDRGYQDVSNPAFASLDTQLLPDGQPSQGRICAYEGRNGHSFGLRENRFLGPDDARGLALAIRQVPLSHTDGGVSSCPSDNGSAVIVVLTYPRLGDIDLFGGLSGCTSISNGHIIVPGSLSELAHVHA